MAASRPKPLEAPVMKTLRLALLAVSSSKIREETDGGRADPKRIGPAQPTREGPGIEPIVPEKTKAPDPSGAF